MADPQTHDRNDLIQPNAENRYEVTKADLPLSCPMPGMYLWSSHPKVTCPSTRRASPSAPTAARSSLSRASTPTTRSSSGWAAGTSERCGTDFL